MADRLAEIRKRAWKELEERKERGYTEEQQKCFLAGMYAMWRFCKLDNSPLFTFGPSSPLPNEL